MELEEEREASLLKVGLVQLLLVALLTVALVHRQNHLSVLLLTLLVFIFGARLWSRFSVRNLRVRMSINRMRVFPGEGVRLSINAENRKILPVWLRLRVPLPHALRAEGTGGIRPGTGTTLVPKTVLDRGIAGAAAGDLSTRFAAAGHR